MPRKRSLLLLSVLHGLIDYCTYRLLTGDFSETAHTSVLTGMGWVLFVLLSSALPIFFGRILDDRPKLPFAPIGCLTVAVALLLSAKSAWAALAIASVGSALFHAAAGGESVMFSRGFFARCAIFLSFGIFGAYAGCSAGSHRILHNGILSALLAAGGVLAYLFCTAQKYPREIRGFRRTVRRAVPPSVTLLCAICMSAGVAAIRTDLSTNLTAGDSRFFTGIALGIGCVIGGFAADRFGPRRTAAVLFAVALPMLTVFSHISACALIGLAAIEAPLPIFLCTTVAALPTHGCFAYGIWGFAGFLGAVPAFFPSKTDSSALTVAAIVLICLLISFFLYTDNCRRFYATSARKTNFAAPDVAAAGPAPHAEDGTIEANRAETIEPTEPAKSAEKENTL